MMAEGIYNMDSNNLDGKFKQWWSVARRSEDPPTPYDYLVNFGLAPQTVQQICWKIVESCSTSTCSGAVDHSVQNLFFTDKVQHASFSDWKGEDYSIPDLVNVVGRYDDSMMVKAVQRGPSSSKDQTKFLQDLQSLAKLLASSCKNLDDYKEETIENWIFVAKECMLCNYSSEVIQYMFDQLNSVDCDSLVLAGLSSSDFQGNHRRAIDHDCLSGIGRVVSKLEHLSISDADWTENAFVDFMAMLGKTNQLKRVDMEVPARFEGDLASSSIKVQDISGGQDLACGIEHLRLRFPDESTEPSFGHQAALQLLCCSPCLNDLHLCLEHFPPKSSTPSIIQAIKKATGLDTLELQIRSEDNDQSSVLAVLDAVKESTSIVDFRFTVMSTSRNANHLHGNKVAEVLEENPMLTTLRYRCGNPDDSDLDDDLFDDEEDEEQEKPQCEWQEKMEYFLRLNNNGRCTARDCNTTLAEFVNLLPPSIGIDLNPYSIQVMRRRRPLTTNEVLTYSFNLGYGLLREAPGLWSATTTGRRKRKRVDGQGMDS